MAIKFIHLVIKVLIFNIIFINILSAEDITIDLAGSERLKESKAEG